MGENSIKRESEVTAQLSRVGLEVENLTSAIVGLESRLSVVLRVEPEKVVEGKRVGTPLGLVSLAEQISNYATLVNSLGNKVKDISRRIEL